MLNILIVDDSAVMRTMIIKTFKLCGIPFGEIMEASNGKEGIEVIDTKWVDLILADINMPVMNGIEMIDKIQKNPQTADTPIIVISTESSQPRIEALKNKGVHFVKKPFTPEILRETITNIIGIKFNGKD